MPLRAGRWGRRLCIALLWALGFVVAGAAISLLSVHLVGSVQGFEGWINEHRIHLFLWRLMLYSATVAGWCWMRKRLLRREPDGMTRIRLLRSERSALVVIVALEIATWLKAS